MSTPTIVDPRTLPTAESVHRAMLADGTVLLARRNPTSRAVIIQGLVRFGAVDTPTDKAGLARFLSETLTRGTSTRSMAQLYEFAESLGASFSVSAGMHTMRFAVRCLAEDVAPMVGLLSEILQSPSFPLNEVELARGEALTEISERDQDTRAVSTMNFYRRLYGDDHPYSVPLDGFADTISSVTRQDLISLYDAHMASRPMLVSVVGAIEPERAQDIIASHWKSWSGPRASAPPALPAPGPLRSDDGDHAVVPDKVQVDLTWGGLGPARHDDDFLTVSLANLVLGGFGMMGRLGLNVREEQGLAYYVYSRVSGGLGPGPWACVAGIAPEDYHQAVRSIESEVERLATELVPDNELNDSRAYMTGSLPLKLESNEGMATVMTEIELYNLGWDYLTRLPERVGAITPEAIREVVERYFVGTDLVLASAGPTIPAVVEPEVSR